MKTTLNALARWSAIFGLLVILALTVPFAALTTALGAPALRAAEWAADRFKQLTKGNSDG